MALRGSAWLMCLLPHGLPVACMRVGMMPLHVAVESGQLETVEVRHHAGTQAHATRNMQHASCVVGHAACSMNAGAVRLPSCVPPPPPPTHSPPSHRSAHSADVGAVCPSSFAPRPSSPPNPKPHLPTSVVPSFTTEVTQCQG
eukprot:359362-Chlamydomonas_euryale.AAC.3